MACSWAARASGTGLGLQARAWFRAAGLRERFPAPLDRDPRVLPDTVHGAAGLVDDVSRAGADLPRGVTETATHVGSGRRGEQERDACAHEGANRERHIPPAEASGLDIRLLELVHDDSSIGS